MLSFMQHQGKHDLKNRVSVLKIASGDFDYPFQALSYCIGMNVQCVGSSGY